MPNKDDDPTKSSDGTPAGKEDDPSSREDPATGDPKDDKETLESIASRMVQSSMDQSIAHVEQGQFAKLNPKVVQLLTAYDKTTRPQGDPSEPEESDPYEKLFPSNQPPDRPGSKLTPLEERGRQAAQQELVGKIRTQVRADELEAMWADDIRALFAELQGQKNFTEEDWKTIDFTNRRLFPPTREGYTAWRQAATALRVKVASPATGGEDEEENSGLDADRQRAAGGKRQPNPASAGAALTDINKATERKKAGKLSGKEFIEIVRRNTSPGVLD